jgi:hypothetical protein
MNLPFNENETSLFFKQLSSDLLSRFAEHSPLFAELLSTIQTQSLSGVPVNQYDKIKYNFFGPEYEFKTINDIEAPEKFNLNEITDNIKNASKQLNLITLSAAQAFQVYAESEPVIPELSSVSFNASFDQSLEKIINVDLTRKNIQFTEVVRSMTLEQIENQPVETAKKLLSHFVELYQ